MAQTATNNWSCIHAWVSTLDKDTQAFWNEVRRSLHNGDLDRESQNAAVLTLRLFNAIYNSDDRRTVPHPRAPDKESAEQASTLPFAKWLGREGKAAGDEYEAGCAALRVRKIDAVHRRYMAYYETTLGESRRKRFCPDYCTNGKPTFEGRDPVTLDPFHARLEYSGTNGLCMSTLTGALYPISAVRDMLTHSARIRMDTGVEHTMGDFIDLTSTDWTKAMEMFMLRQRRALMQQHMNTCKAIYRENRMLKFALLQAYSDHPNHVVTRHAKRVRSDV